MSINPAHMKKFICGVLVGICLPFVVAYVFVAFGGMPVATKGQPLPLERFIAGKALHAAMDRDVGKTSPLPLDEVNLLARARVYQAKCGAGHGRGTNNHQRSGKSVVARGGAAAPRHVAPSPNPRLTLQNGPKGFPSAS